MTTFIVIRHNLTINIDKVTHIEHCIRQGEDTLFKASVFHMEGGGEVVIGQEEFETIKHLIMPLTPEEERARQWARWDEQAAKEAMPTESLPAVETVEYNRAVAITKAIDEVDAIVAEELARYHAGSAWTPMQGDRVIVSLLQFYARVIEIDLLAKSSPESEVSE